MSLNNCPVPQTCPAITNCVKDLKVVETSLTVIDTLIDYIDTDNPVQLDLINRIKYNLDTAITHINIFNELELLRDANTELREWGYTLKEKLDKYENQS